MAKQALASTGLPSKVSQALLDGVALSRGSALEGAEGILGAAHVRAAAKAFTSATPAQQQRVLTLLDKATSPAEGAVLLKAVAARGVTPELEKFAGAIRGLPFATLISRTTVIDLSHADGEMTGLRQRWSGSCVPTALQIVRAEADPMIAFALTEDVLNDGEARDEIAAEQKAWLEANKGVAVAREAKGGAGIAYAEIGALADQLAGPMTHARYSQDTLDDYLPAKARLQHLDAVRAALEDGLDVPVVIPGHIMVLTDTRVGPDAQRRFLIQDPWNGTSFWLTEAQISKDGFGIPDFVDKTNLKIFYLPK